MLWENEKGRSEEEEVSSAGKLSVFLARCVPQRWREQSKVGGNEASTCSSTFELQSPNSSLFLSLLPSLKLCIVREKPPEGEQLPNRNRRFLPWCLPADLFGCQLRWHMYGKSFRSGLARRATGFELFCQEIRMIVWNTDERTPMQSWRYSCDYGQLMTSHVVCWNIVLRPYSNQYEFFLWDWISRKGSFPTFSRFFILDAIHLVWCTDHANSRYEWKSFYSNSERRNMAADSDRVVFRNQWLWPRVHGRANACDSFIYKRATDVIRISFNTLHLLFTSFTPPASWKPMSDCVSSHVSFRLSIPLCRTDVSSCLTSGF